MQNLQNPDQQPSNDEPAKQPASTHQVSYRTVSANSGSKWLLQAKEMFISSLGGWFAITLFISILLIIPKINLIFSILMPVIIAGLMLGCQHASEGNRIKFEHLFAGFKANKTGLLRLSLIYALLSIFVMIIAKYILLYLGISLQEYFPENINQMNNAQLNQWFIALDKEKFIPDLLISLIIPLTLMIPIFMAYWFAPALVVIKKMPVVQALKTSYMACKDNYIAFLFYGLILFLYLIGFLFILSTISLFIPPLSLIVMMLGYIAFFAISIISIYTSYIDIFDDSIPTDKTNTNNATMVA